MQLFLADFISDKKAILQDSEYEHCVRVLRKEVDNSIDLIDGKGNYALGKISEITKKQVSIDIQKVINNFGENEWEMGLVFSPLKSQDRTEFLIEKAVELGVTHLFPVLCQRTEKKGFQRDRILKIIISALKQSKRSRIPFLGEFIPFQKTNFSEWNSKLMGWCEEETNNQLNYNQLETNKLLFAIGPEGDFSTEEVNFAKKQGFESFSLGNQRLRSETAGIYLLTTFNFYQNVKKSSKI